MSKIERAINSKEVMKLKIFIGILLAIAALLSLTVPLPAASLGISPSHTELEVPANGSATADFQVYYFSGDLQVSLVDIPLTVEPDIIHIEPSAEPVSISITIYGDEALGSQVYDGYIKFLGMSEGTVAVAVQVKARISNIVEGQPLPEVPLETAPEETSPEAIEGQAPEPPAAEEQGGIAGLSLNMIILIAGGLVFLGLIILSIALLRRKKY